MAMTRSAMYQIRIDEMEKQETFAVFNALGVSPAQAVRMFFSQVRRTNSIPFPLEYTPNEKTAKILEDSRNNIGVNTAKGADDLFKKLGI